MDLFGESNDLENLFDAQVTTSVTAPKKKNKAAKKNAKVDYSKAMESAFKSPYICKNHEGVHMRVRENPKGSDLCGSCGFKCEGKLGHLSCPKLITCFHLCTACRVCPKNHVLRNCISLTQFEDKNPLYASNKFKCMGCEVEQQVGPRGVLHCGSCSVSVCLGCVDQLGAYWEQKNQQLIETGNNIQ